MSSENVISSLYRRTRRRFVKVVCGYRFNSIIIFWSTYTKIISNY